MPSGARNALRIILISSYLWLKVRRRKPASGKNKKAISSSWACFALFYKMSWHTVPKTPAPAYGGGFGSSLGVSSAPAPEVSATLPPGSDSISCVGFSPDSQHVSAASWDGTVRIFSLVRGANGAPQSLTPARESPNVGAPILDAKWESSGQSMFTGDCNGSLKRWDIATNSGTEMGKVRHWRGFARSPWSHAQRSAAKQAGDSVRFDSAQSPPPLTPSSTYPSRFAFFPLLSTKLQSKLCTASRKRAGLSPVAGIRRCHSGIVALRHEQAK